MSRAGSRAGSRGVEIRPATPDDVTAIRAVLAAHGNDSPIVTVDIVGPYLRHLVEHHRALVAVDGRAIVGYGAAVDTGLAVHLADLFVMPARLGQGIGRPLLAAVLEGAARRTTFASGDPRALPIYVRAGMAPLWPCLYLAGDAAAVRQAGAGMARADPTAGSAASAAASAGPLTVEDSDWRQISALEAEWTGAARPTDHAYWASQADADAFVVLESGRPSAAGYARARQVGAARTIDRLVIAPFGDPVAATLAALGRSARGGPVELALPGPHPALRPLLEGGFRITDRDTFMASQPDLVDPARLLPNAGML